MGVLALADPARDPDRLAGRDLPVHGCRGDPDALLAAGLLEAMELRTVQELPEDLRHLGLDDARPIVLDHHEEATFALGQLGVPLHRLEAEVAYLDVQLRQDAGLLAGVEGVVHRFLDRSEQGRGGVVEAGQVPVLREELRDGDLALLLGQRLRGGPLRRLDSGGACFGRGLGSGLGTRRRHLLRWPRLVEQTELRPGRLAPLRQPSRASFEARESSTQPCRDWTAVTSARWPSHRRPTAAT